MRQMASCIRGETMGANIVHLIWSTGERVTVTGPEGASLAIKGSKVAATRKPLDVNTVPEYMREGRNNVANANRMVFQVIADDFHAMPGEDSLVVTDEETFQVSRSFPEKEKGKAFAYHLICYRQPQADSATTDPTTGLRVNFAPPDQDQ